MNTTRYKEKILDTLIDNPIHPTVNELYDLVKSKHPKIGLATMYRNLEKLLLEGKVIKFNSDGNYDRYDATVEDHYHMICNDCGKVYDIPFKIADDLPNKVNYLEGHKILSYELTFSGICRECLNNKKEN